MTISRCSPSPKGIYPEYTKSMEIEYSSVLELLFIVIDIKEPELLSDAPL